MTWSTTQSLIKILRQVNRGYIPGSPKRGYLDDHYTDVCPCEICLAERRYAKYSLY